MQVWERHGVKCR